MKLTIELVPETSWFSNLRSELPKKDWDRLRSAAYRKAGYRCEVCGGKGPKWPVECHEKWEYDDENRIQKLIGTTALCPDCHMVKHIGFAGVQGKTQEAIKHLAKVNEISMQEAVAYVVSAFEEWERRSNHLWTLDLSWLNGKQVKFEEEK